MSRLHLQKFFDKKVHIIRFDGSTVDGTVEEYVQAKDNEDSGYDGIGVDDVWLDEPEIKTIKKV